MQQALHICGFHIQPWVKNFFGGVTASVLNMYRLLSGLVSPVMQCSYSHSNFSVVGFEVIQR